jgi:hypothetical protein
MNNLLTSGEQENLLEEYTQVTLNLDYAPTEADTVTNHVLRSGRTAQGIVANTVITVFNVINNC